ncbi:MAG: type II toxin-antitoxin system VapC family toxin [Legionella sp.]|nr:type II toxin-antitoxin system VapC family toxin [Legionella sp.]
MKGLLLDTHVWIWLMEGNVKLNNHHQNIINKAAQFQKIGIAAISLWEVAMLVEKGRINLTKSLLVWVQEALALPGIELQALSPEIAVESSQLRTFHGDPEDRIIVATARINNLSLFTFDQNILDYAKKEHLSLVSS